MRRIVKDPYKLVSQLRSSAAAIGNEPQWPLSAPTQAEVAADAAEIDQLITDMIAIENQMQSKREEMRLALEKGFGTMRRIDHVTSGLYGESGGGKVSYGLRPIDRTRNMPPPTPKVSAVRLADGIEPSTILAKWKSLIQATYEIQWFGDAEMSELFGASSSARASYTISGLLPGTQVWVRVRARRSRGYGEWSDAASRIVNV